MPSSRLPLCILAPLLGVVGSACRTPAPDAQHPSRLVAAWMIGSFTSTEQHTAAPEDFFDIRLAMAPVWTDRADGPWLYVEQAVATAIDRPYRQRIYHLVDQDDGSVRSEVYTLPGDPLAWAGAQTTPERFDALPPDQLQPRTGCSIVLRRVDDRTWVGSTGGNGCPSERSGAAYATAEVTLTAQGMATLDRGFDAAGKQVWGSTKGPYRFQKVALAPR